jgi:hypothetical protein
MLSLLPVGAVVRLCATHLGISGWHQDQEEQATAARSSPRLDERIGKKNTVSEFL